jgi:hypothetical protein
MKSSPTYYGTLCSSARQIGDGGVAAGGALRILPTVTGTPLPTQREWRSALLGSAFGSRIPTAAVPLAVDPMCGVLIEVDGIAMLFHPLENGLEQHGDRESWAELVLTIDFAMSSWLRDWRLEHRRDLPIDHVLVPLFLDAEGGPPASPHHYQAMEMHQALRRFADLRDEHVVRRQTLVSHHQRIDSLRRIRRRMDHVARS